MTLAGGDDNESTPLPPFTATAAVCLDMMDDGCNEPYFDEFFPSWMLANLAWKGNIFHRKVRYEKQIEMTVNVLQVPLVSKFIVRILQDH